MKFFGKRLGKPRKLLIAFPSPTRGGMENHALTLGEGAAAGGWETHAAFPGFPGLASLQLDFGRLGIPYHPLEICDVLPSTEAVTEEAAFERTSLLLESLRPDAVLFMLCGVQYGLGPMLACADRGVPTLVVFDLVREG